MPIADREGYPPGHFGKIYDQIIAPAVKEAGYEPRLASNSRNSVIIPLEIVSQLLNAPLAICDISDLNPNVMFELGFRQAFDKPVVIMKDDKTISPFDINSIRYVPYGSARLYEDVIKSRSELVLAIRSTVSGSEHSVNSLVRLLGVSAAARKEGNEDPASARLELIERSLATVATSVAKLVEKEQFKYKPQTSPSLSNRILELTNESATSPKISNLADLIVGNNMEWNTLLEDSEGNKLAEALIERKRNTASAQLAKDQPKKKL